MEQSTTQLLGFGDTIKAVGQQLNSRKGLIVQRTLLVAWPALIAAAFVLIINALNQAKAITIDDISKILPYAYAFLVWVIFSVVYYLVLNHIFTVEKRIWIDSFFDNRSLEPKQSWKIARRLFVPAFMVSFHAFLRYFLPPLILFILFFIGSLKAMPLFVSASQDQFFAGMGIVSLMVVVAIASYSIYIQIKLRFLQFIFLDLYGSEGFTYGKIFAELAKINKVKKTALKALVYDFGAGSLNGFIASIANTFSQATKGLGPVGEVAGSMIGVVAKEVGKQAVSYANIVAHYVLYRYARVQLYPDQGQVVNEHIYDLAK